MKLKITSVMLVLLSFAGSTYAAPLKPVVLASKGQAEVSTAKGGSSTAELKQSITAGSIISTGDASRIAIALAPGQLVTLKKNSKLKIVSTHDAAKGQGAVIQLLAGGVRCNIDPEHGHKEPVFKLLAGDSTIQAKGTSWDTGTAADGKVTTVVLSSTVSVALPGGALVSVTAGSVLVTTYNASGAATGAKLVNLVSGVSISFASDGTAGESAVATTAELGAAASAFQTAVNESTGPTPPATVQVVANINTTLANQGLPTVTVPSAGADTPGSGTDTAPPPGRDVTDTTSPSAPQP